MAQNLPSAADSYLPGQEISCSCNTLSFITKPQS